MAIRRTIAEFSDDIATADIADGSVTAAKVASDVATTAGTQTFTNKTLTAPTLTTPALGTPASGVVTNLSGVLPSGVTGGSGLTALGTVAGNTTFSDTITANDLIISGDPSLDTGWQEYYGSSTKVGWSNITENRKWIWYKKIGSVVWIVFHLEGTSNSTTTSFTMPYIMNTWPSSQVSYTSMDLWTYNNSSSDADAGHINIDADGSSTARLTRSAGAWTASGTKIAAGTFFYPTNET
jgi:hypothetical protein